MCKPFCEMGVLKDLCFLKTSPCGSSWSFSGARPNDRNRGACPRVDADIRLLIRRMARENPTWGAPRIHGELPMLGFEVSESTVSRYMPRMTF